MTSERPLFGTDGIRGQANLYPITPEVALQVGKAIASVFRGTGRSRTLIGKDTRLSGYMLETALTSGLVSMGMDVFLLGPIPTPSVAHLTRSMNAAVGIMLTASHNPFDDNGIKIFDSQGFKLSDDLETRIEDQVRNPRAATEHVRSENLGKAYRIEDARGRYIEYAKRTIGNLSLDGLKIVLDCANGAAYRIGPWIFEELGVTVVRTATQPDGFNINQDCGALYPENLARAVVNEGADAGIAFDGDADRVVLCDSHGRILDGDHIVAMCALDMQRSGSLRGDGVVVTVMSNLGLHEALKSHGIHVVTTPVGDRNVIEWMRREGYNLGGEKSGHLVFMDHGTTGDGIIAALQVLKLMRTSGKPLADLAACIQELPQRICSVPVTGHIPLHEMSRLLSLVRECEEELGTSGRVLVRYSGTESCLRILVEGPDAARVASWSEALCAAAADEVKRDIEERRTRPDTD